MLTYQLSKAPVWRQLKCDTLRGRSSSPMRSSHKRYFLIYSGQVQPHHLTLLGSIEAPSIRTAVSQNFAQTQQVLPRHPYFFSISNTSTVLKVRGVPLPMPSNVDPPRIISRFGSPLKICKARLYASGCGTECLSHLSAAAPN